MRPSVEFSGEAEESIHKPFVWCIGIMFILAVIVIVRAFIGRQRSEERYSFATITFVASLVTGAVQLELVKSVIQSLPDATISLSFILALDIIEEFTTCFACHLLAAFCATERAADCAGHAGRVGTDWSLVLGNLGVMGSITKFMALGVVSISTVFALRVSALPLSMMLRYLGLGKRATVSWPTMLFLLIGVSICVFTEFSHALHHSGHKAYHLHTGAYLSPFSGAVLLVFSMAASTVEGQSKERLIHRSAIDSVEVQNASSRACLLLSIALLYPCMIWENLTVCDLFQALTFALPIITGNALAKASDQLVGIKLTKAKDYTWKKASGILKILPAIIIEAAIFYVMLDTTIGRPLDVRALYLFAGTAVCMIALMLDGGDVPCEHENDN